MGDEDAEIELIKALDDALIKFETLADGEWEWRRDVNSVILNAGAAVAKLTDTGDVKPILKKAFSAFSRMIENSSRENITTFRTVMIEVKECFGFKIQLNS
jgi:hypothetical protein